MSTFADWQSIQQWTGDPLAQATGNAIGGGTVDTGPLQVGSWASIILWVKATTKPVTAVVTQTISGGPPGLTITQTITVAAGAQSVTSIIMYGTVVEVVFTGGGVGGVLDYAVVPSNTSVATSVSSNPIITRVTALPAAPIDTQVVSFAPDPVTFPGVEWLLIYNASTGYWDVIGGSPLYDQDDNDYITGNVAVWANLSLRTLVLPHEGYYDCTVNCDIANTAGIVQQSLIALSIDGWTPTTANDSGNLYTGAVNPLVTVERTYYDRHVAAAGVVRVVYGSGGSSVFHWPRMEVMPRRIK